MRRNIVLVVWAALVPGLAGPLRSPAPTRAAVQAWCISTTDSTAQRLLLRLTELASSTDSLWVRGRAALGNMPLTQADQVFMVGDDSLCHRASAALDSSFFDQPRGQAVYLVRVGARYVVYPPGPAMGEFGYVVFMDSTFHKLATTTW